MEKSMGMDMEQIKKTNREFRLLDEEHHRLEKELAELVRRKVLTPEKEMEKRRLQKKKLSGKDRMTEILREYAGDLSAVRFNTIPRKAR